MKPTMYLTPLFASVAGQRGRRKAAFAFLWAALPFMTTVNFYVDGFNLYYGSLKNRWPQFKWLNLQTFCEGLVAGSTVKRVRYFTAQAQNTPHDSNVAARQQVYLRALATLPKVSIHYGLFVVRDVLMPLTNNPTPDNPAIVRITRTEEKRTDVNLATALLLDCLRQRLR